MADQIELLATTNADAKSRRSIVRKLRDNI